MKKELFAGALLIIILAGSLLNSHYLATLTKNICTLIDESESAASSDNWALSEQYAVKAIRLWMSKDSYTHVVLRHSDIDSMTDDFYELLEYIYAKDSGSVLGAARLVTAHLTSIRDIERIRFGSIF